MDPRDNQLPSINSLETGAVSTNVPAPAEPPEISIQTPTTPTPLPMSAPAIADDADLIEKEWVLKARQIVEQTKNDPYIQNQKMNQMKADYIKKRYNKDLKVEEA